MLRRILHLSRLYGTLSRDRLSQPYRSYPPAGRLTVSGLTCYKSCISEAQKYQGALYRPEKDKKSKQSGSKALVSHKAYVEDAGDEYHHNSHIEIVDPPMPEAPSPPSAAPGFKMESNPVNVFDFLVDGDTPNASRLDLPAPELMNLIEDTPKDYEEVRERDPVRVRFGVEAQSVSDLVQYGSGPVPTEHYHTPAPKAERERKKEKKDRGQSRTDKLDKKRKRLHVDTQDLSVRDDDEAMTDAPPVLHSGLTGGLNRLLSRPSVFPPSPDYSGGDAADASPGSPLKKTKHTKRGRIDTINNNIMSLISTRNPSREHSDHSLERPRRKHRRHREESERPSRKLIEYAPANDSGAVQEDDHNQMVVYTPRCELLLSFVNKGPESERGLSMNKALKRYHRERNAMGIGLPRAEEEKELWRSLRMKRNERGEIVLFM